MEIFNKYFELKQYAFRKGFTVYEVSDTLLKEFWGMNYYTAQEVGFSISDKRTILINQSLDDDTKYKVLRSQIDKIKEAQRQYLSISGALCTH